MAMTSDEYIVDCGNRSDLAHVSTVEELDAGLDDTEEWARENGRPVWVYIFTPKNWDGPVSSLGLGRDFSFSSFDNAHAVGDMDGGQPAEWWDGSQGGYSFPGRGIPVEVAREAAREFVRTGQRPTNVEWTEAD
jgi:hypothetical protein